MERIRNGLIKTYYKNGFLKSEQNYFNNKEHGRQKLYFKNGILSSEYNCINGNYCGINRGYSTSGSCAFIVTLTHSINRTDFVRGLLNGIYISFKYTETQWFL